MSRLYIITYHTLYPQPLHHTLNTPQNRIWNSRYARLTTPQVWISRRIYLTPCQTRLLRLWRMLLCNLGGETSNHPRRVIWFTVCTSSAATWTAFSVCSSRTTWVAQSSTLASTSRKRICSRITRWEIWMCMMLTFGSCTIDVPGPLLRSMLLKGCPYISSSTRLAFQLYPRRKSRPLSRQMDNKSSLSSLPGNFDAVSGSQVNSLHAMNDNHWAPLQ